MKPQSRLEPFKNIQHVPKATGKIVTNVTHNQPRDYKNLVNAGYNLHKRNNSEAQASRNQHYLGQKRASEHFVDISQQYAQHLQRQIGDLSNRSPLPSARGATTTMQNSRDNSANQRGLSYSDVQNRKVSKSTLESRQSPKPTKKVEMQHRKNPSLDLRPQDVSRLQKKTDVPAYFKLNIGGNQHAQTSTAAAKKLYSNQVSPGKQHKTPPPKKKTERPTTASSRTTSTSKGGSHNQNDISHNQSDSRRPSSLRLQQDVLSSHRESKNTEGGGSLHSYRRSKEDIYAPDPKTTPKGYLDNKKNIAPNLEKRNNSRPATGDSYMNDYINRFDLYSKRVSKERVTLEKPAHDTKKQPVTTGLAMVQEANPVSAKIYNNNPTLQSVLNKVGKYMGKSSGSSNVDQQPKKSAESKFANNHPHQQQRIRSRQNSLADVAETRDSGRNHSRKPTEAEVWAHIGSRKSSYGQIAKGKSSPVASRDNSPREVNQKGNRATSMSINELKELLRANKKLVEMVEPNSKLVMNQSLVNEERRFRKQSLQSEQDFELFEESLQVYKNLRDVGPSYAKDSKGDHKMHSGSTEDDSKNSHSALNKRPLSNISEGNRIPRHSNNLTNSPNTQASRPSTKGDGDEKQGKSSHKKGSRSVAISNPVDQMMNGVQLPINLNSMRKERLFTPEMSENTSANTSLINEYQAMRIRDTNKADSRSTTPTSKHGKQLRADNPKSSQNNPFNHRGSQPNVTPQSSEKKIKLDEADDQHLREGLIKLIHQSFKTKGNCPPTSLDYYRLVKMIGKGAFGKVYLGVHLLTGENVALKSIEKQYMKDEASKRKIFQEVLILKRCHHKNIIRLLEVFENKKYLFIVQEYASQGDLLGYVKEKGRLTESEAKGIFKQIAHGVQHCHQQSILHRDIKLDNILLDKNMVVKICDFGVSRFVKKGQMINEQCGTPAYIAPEIIQDKGYEGSYADLWSMGVLLYAMITGTVPFRANTLDDLHYAIIDGTYSCPNYLSEEAKDLISRFLKVNPYARIDINEVDKHPWFNPNRLEDGRSKSIVGKTRSTGMDYRLDNKRQTVPDVGLANLEEVLNGQNSKVIDPTVLKMVEALGYPRDFIIHSVQNNACNHASACFFLLAKKLQLLN